MFANDFDGRVLPFDSDGSHGLCRACSPPVRRAGRPTAPQDLMIAAIARAKDATHGHAQHGGF